MARGTARTGARSGPDRPLIDGSAAAWRDPAEVIAAWDGAGAVDPSLFRHTVRGAWWETLAAAGITLLVTREYEHLVLALRAGVRGPAISYLRLPHPSGLVVDRARGLVHVAATRNPNQVIDLAPVSGTIERWDRSPDPVEGRPLVPVRSRFYPGSLYLHDLALIGGDLHANAVGQNAIVRLAAEGGWSPVWWPRCVETEAGPIFQRNHLQLNSIAAGPDLAGSFFSASTDRIGRRRPGHRDFPVDRRGVVFSGATREPIARGLTRPHSARLDPSGRLWVDDSGYGTVGTIESGRYEPVVRLPGWTRGLAFHDRIAFVGTSRVLPRFHRYAPGLDLAGSVCGVHALDTTTGTILGSLIWPAGNQIFAIDHAPAALTTGFPFRAGRRHPARERDLFYAFRTESTSKDTPS